MSSSWSISFMLEQLLKSLGSSARILPIRKLETPQAKMLWSLDEWMISNWRRRNAFFPSPYSIGMFTSNRPINEYALSSTRVVVRLAAHDMI